MLGIVISVPFTHSCLLTSLVQIMEHLENRGEEERDVALLVWSGSLSDLICLDRLQKIGIWGQENWRSQSVCVTGLDTGQNRPLPLSCLLTLYPRAGTAWLLIFTVSVKWANSVPHSIYGYDVLGRAQPISLAASGSRGCFPGP